LLGAVLGLTGGMVNWMVELVAIVLPSEDRLPVEKAVQSFKAIILSRSPKPNGSSS